VFRKTMPSGLIQGWAPVFVSQCKIAQTDLWWNTRQKPKPIRHRCSVGIFMFSSKTALVLAFALALGGCETTTAGSGPGEGSATLAGAFSGASSGSAIGRGGNEAAAAATNAALGGLIGSKLGASLNDDDRRLAYEAQISALDRGAPGAPVPWRNPASGRHGNIVPGPPYDQKGATCRGFSHTVTIDGQLETARGTACRGPDGAWTAVS
jgi:surface antigen